MQDLVKVIVVLFAPKELQESSRPRIGGHISAELSR